MASPLDSVPIIDLSLPESEAAANVRSACIGSGFFYVTGHGVPQELVDNMFQQQQEAFKLPLDEEILDPANQSIGDTKEGFYFAREIAADCPEAKKPLHGPNVWPPSDILPSYRTVTMEYFEAVNALGLRLIRLLALTLGLEATYFDSYFQPPMMVLRPLHYTAQISKPTDGVFGAGAHSDYGMLTILKTDEVEGLQIYTGEKSSTTPQSDAWVGVPPIPGAFIINLGDMLEVVFAAMSGKSFSRAFGTTLVTGYIWPTEVNVEKA
eukprot:gene28005-31102_t